MMTRIKSIFENRLVIRCLKLLICSFIVVWIANCINTKGIDSFYEYRDYTYQNDLSECISAGEATSVEQLFISKGNTISNIRLYLGEIDGSDLSIEIVDEGQKVLASRIINTSDYIPNAWNTISIECDKVERNGNYCLKLSGEKLQYITLNTGNAYNKIYGTCFLSGSEVPYTLAMGFNEVYRYITLGNILQIFALLIIVAFLAGVLCLAVCKFEDLQESFTNAEKKEGLSYALFFSVYTVLLFNPLDKVRTEAVEFTRVIGAGFNTGIDVSRRTSNFSHWFIYFGIAFTLYFLLANYLKKKEYIGENHKVVLFLDNLIIVANTMIIFRGITFFYNESQTTDIFYFSDYIIWMLLIISLAYIALGLEKYIRVLQFWALLISGWMLALPASIVIYHDWSQGKVLLGLQVVVSILVIAVIKILKINWSNDGIAKIINVMVVPFSLIPFFTSFYIEFVVWLNQREIFWTHLRRNYFICTVAGVIGTAVICAICYKRNNNFEGWKKLTYPFIIFGIACLWVQIPAAQEYNVDIFESANSSILISDFLNFGDIPIVQHYGGHMMSGVWEGIIYALLNNDVFGATFSPYGGYILTIIVVLFYFIIKYFWNEDAAIVVTLVFPFYNFISYWGLGLLIVLAAMTYAKKNTFLRAALFWLACIWVAIYKLDLGFAFIFASIVALAIYIVLEKNINACKQLLITLVCWGAFGLIMWFSICLIKNVNPINRLFEFLYINLSNQNWAYETIGDTSQTKFAFTYILLPFMSVIAILYTVVSSRIRRNNVSRWLAVLIIGLSYFYNFSRGLVRHSLAENALSICTWTVFLFFSLFVAEYKNMSKLILPCFTIGILLFTLFQTDWIFSGSALADSGFGHVGSFTETWTLGRFADEEVEGDNVPKTYWEKLLEEKQVIERVELGRDCCGQELEKTIQSYQIMVDALLDGNETFVDFINKTSIYPLLGRQNPVYVSQSPLQLSGQFTQEEFVKEIQGVPIVLMPYDWNNNRASESLDGVPNNYRYYKVVEYIFNHYVPLCVYEHQYAIWCLPERYDEMAETVSNMSLGTENIENIKNAENLVCGSMEMIKNTDGSINLNYNGIDPMLLELQNAIDCSAYAGAEMNVKVTYETDVLGPMQLFYTTEPEENYVGEKVSTYDLTEYKGMACFKVPITQYTRLRLDTPEASSVRISSVSVGGVNCELATYGYDGPYLQNDGVSYSYLPYVHNYDVRLLPVIWAEGDKKNSVSNPVIVTLEKIDGLYKYQLPSSAYSKDGNYLKIHINYDGNDQGGKVEIDDEMIGATLRLGNCTNGQFETKYLYTFTIKEGSHDYMFRVSNDYYWYLEETDAAKLECDGQLLDVTMQILEGD